MQVEIINEIDTENAIRLLLYSNKTVEVLASLLSKCDEEKVSNILECMINESNNCSIVAKTSSGKAVL